MDDIAAIALMSLFFAMIPVLNGDVEANIVPVFLQTIVPLCEDIKAIVDAQSQIDPSFKTQRLYTRLSAAEVRRQLISQKQYTDAELPSEQTIRRCLNQLGYYPGRIAKNGAIAFSEARTFGD